MSIRIDLQLPQTTLELAPGDAVEVPITLTNHGGVVDAFYIEIGELQPGWYTLPANEVRLFPEQSGTLVVRFHPPAGPETLAGGYPFSVLATSRDNPHEQTLVNGIIILAATPGLLLDLQPRRVQARQALYGIMLTNPGNAPRPIVLRATDPEEALVYTVGEEQPMLVADGATATVGGTPAVVAPPLKLETPLASGAGRLEYALELAAGAAVMVPLQTKARKRIWFGPNQTYQFEVAATPPGVEWEASEAQTVSGEQVYQPLLAGWGALPFALRRALLIGIPLLILALILFLLLRSTGTAPPANNLTPGADTGATQTALALAAQQTASAQQTALALAAQQTAAASAQQTALAAAAGTQTALAAAGQGRATPVAVVPTAVATGVPVNAGVPLIRAFYMVVPGPGAPAGDLTANEPRLGWDVSAAQNLRLDQDALLSDLLGLPNTQLVNYRLVATGTTSVTTTTLGVLLVGPPIIDSLKVSTSTLAAQDIKLVAGQVVTLTQGERATLAWQVKGARTVDLDGTPVPLDAQGTGRFDVTPPGSHTYILHASNASGTVGRAVTLAVLTLTPTPTPTCIVEDYVVRESAQITVVPGTTDIGNHCDDCATSITLPFPYVLYGRPFTQAAVTSNGQIAFGTAAADATRDNSCLPDANAQDAIFAHWDDLRTDRSAGAGIYTSVSGEAPNRLFNIEWRGVYGDNLAPVHFEVRLYESLQQFDVIYATVGEQGRGATVGVQREGRIHRTEYACNAPRLNEGQMLTFYLPGCGPGGPGGPGQPDKTPFVPPTATHPPQEPGNPGGLPTPTETPSATPTITATPQPATATLIAQFTATPTAPATATATATVTPTLPPTRERPPKERPTATSTAMPTNTPTNTVTPTNTATPPNTATATVTQTATPACLITNYPSTDVGQSLVATCVTGCFDATITSTLSINTPATIGGIEVTGLNITSTYAAGLQVYLISPQGTTVPLFNRVCGDTPWPAGSTGFTLAESGAALIGSNCPPGASVYQPQGDLTSLIGQPANGTWRLVVTLTSLGSDNITNEAVLYGWGLRISSGAGCPPPPPRRTATATPTPFPTFPPFNSPTATVTPTASTTPFCNITTFTQDVPVSSFLGTPVASSLDVPSGIPFSQIEVTNLVITAPIPANINLSLISPQNTVVQLMTGACPSGPPWTSANTGFSLSDLAGIPIGAACPPGFGTYRPVGSLSTFVGQSSGGAWRLLISGDTATVSSWTLEFIDGTGCGGGLNTVANGGGLLPPTVTPRMTPTAIRTPAQPPGLGPPATPFTGAATATPIAAPASASPVPPATATPYRKGPPPRGGYADPVGATNSALDGALAADHSLGLLAGWRMTNQLVDIIFKECLLRLWSVPAGASP